MRRWTVAPDDGCNRAAQFACTPAHQVAPELRPQRLLALNRKHSGIENRLDSVRDVSFDKDACRIRAGTGALRVASLRNLAIPMPRLGAQHPFRVPNS